MSHFTAMVIGDDVEAALQPYHEFECTGTNDEYIQDVDRTAEAREEFASSTRAMLRKLSDGTLHSFFDAKGEWRPEFSQPAGGEGIFTRRTYRVPEGFEKVEAHVSEVESFAEWAAEYYGAAIVPHGAAPDKIDAHKYGFTVVDAAGEVVQIIDRTNPNKRWDWWTVGGRWPGFLLLKTGGKADQARKGAVDWDGMRAAARAERGAGFDKVMAGLAAAGAKLPEWDEIREAAQNIDLARKVLWGHPGGAVVRSVLGEGAGLGDGNMRSYYCNGDREAFLARIEREACQTFAVVKGGQWHERGHMGWWAHVSDEKSGWSDEFEALFAATGDDEMITIVDCHI